MSKKVDAVLQKRLGVLLSRHPSDPLRSGDALSPGCTAAEIVRRLQEHGIPAEHSLVSLYNWRNGTTRNRRLRLDEIMFMAPFHLIQLQEALKSRRALLEEQEKFPDLEIWSPDWIPFAADGYGSHLIIDVSARASGTVRVSINDPALNDTIATTLRDYIDFHLRCVEERVVAQEEGGELKIDLSRYYELGAECLPEHAFWKRMKEAFAAQPVRAGKASRDRKSAPKRAPKAPKQT